MIKIGLLFAEGCTLQQLVC